MFFIFIYGITCIYLFSFVNYVFLCFLWTAPGDQSRHQLDYIPVKRRFRNSVKNVQILPGADT